MTAVEDLVKFQDWEAKEWRREEKFVWIAPSAVASVVSVSDPECPRAHVRMKDGGYYNVFLSAEEVVAKLRSGRRHYIPINPC